MLKRGALILWLPLLLSLAAEERPVLPGAGEPPPVDTITPVPLSANPLNARDPLRPTMPKELKIDNQGTVEGSVETGVRLGGPVKIDGDNGLQAFADTAVLDLQEKSVTLEGKVSVYQGNILQRGRRAVYYYERKYLDSRDLTISTDPIIMEAGKFTMEDHGGKQVFVGEDASVTTDDVEHPNFWVRAAETKVYPGDKVTFKNLRVYAGDVPIFWLPYLSQPMNAQLGYHLLPGARSSWGPYLLNTYGIMLGGKLKPQTGDNEDAWLLSQWHLDLRGLRGVGTGVDLSDTRLKDNNNLTGLSLYYLNDLAPETRNSGVPRGVIDPDRYRIELKHRVPLDLADAATWYLDANLTLLSDSYYLQDFEPPLYRKDPEPDSTLGVFRRDEKSLLSLFTRLQLNDFQSTATRLPELAYDQARGPWCGLPVLHEGSTSLAVLGAQAGDLTRSTIIEPLLAMPLGDSREAGLLSRLSTYERDLTQRIRNLLPGDPRIAALKSQLLDTGFTRFHTYHEFSLPIMLGGAFSLTPQAGVGFTRYMAVESPATSDDRLLMHAGVEAAVKFSRDLGDWKNHAWGVDGLLHIVQPYATWSVLSSNDVDPLYPGVDRLTDSTRPPTLSPARFTAIDDMHDWNILRLGVRNRLLTRRDGQTHDWLYLNTYLDAFVTDPILHRSISNLYNDLRFEPVPWMSVAVETQFPVIDGGSGFNEFATVLRFLPTSNLEFSLGYRWLNNNPAVLNSDQIDLRAYARINENWGVGMQQVIELDDQTIELQQYTLHRDLGNWIAAIGLTRRDNRVQQGYGVVVSLTLKDFPSFSLPFRIDSN
ncbi:MAG: LPS assembly protein LptD [Verrucomicrobiota bacterium]